MARSKKWLRRILFALLVLVVLYAGASYWLGAVADSRLEAAVAAIRERGEPLDLLEMAPPPVPDEENAAIPLLEVEALLVDPDDATERSLERLKDHPLEVAETDRDRIASWIGENAAAIERAEEAARRPRSRFAPERWDPLEGEGPHVIPFLTVSRLLANRGYLRAIEGRADEAFRDALTVLRLGERASPEPTLISCMVRVAIEQVALRQLRTLLPRAVPPEATRDELLATLDKIRIGPAFRRSLLGERCFGQHAFQRVLEDPDFAEKFGSGEEELALRWLPDSLSRLDQSRYLKLMAKAIDLAGRPWFETRSGWRGLAAEARDGPWYAILTNALFFSFERIATRVEAHRADLDLARLALTRPDSPKPPPGTERGTIDPFTGEPYRSEPADGGGHRIWSVGSDEKDDGGVEAEERRHDHGDLVWFRPG